MASRCRTFWCDCHVPQTSGCGAPTSSRRWPAGARRAAVGLGVQDFGGGDLVGGKFADQALVPKIFGFLLWNAAFLGVFSVFASFKAVTVVVLFLVGTDFALVLALQTSLMNVAREVRTLTIAFNLSNTIGAVLGAAIGQEQSLASDSFGSPPYTTAVDRYSSLLIEKTGSNLDVYDGVSRLEKPEVTTWSNFLDRDN